MRKLEYNLDIVIGGQYGSEAKGLVSSKLATCRSYDVLMCVNSAQAGHTAPVFSKEGVFEGMMCNRTLPSSSVGNREAPIFIGPGAVINLDVLFEEVEEMEDFYGIPIRERLFISEMASVITPEILEYARSEEMEKIRAKRDGLDPEDFDKKSFGSTKEGVSQALSMRASRTCPIIRDFMDELLDEGIDVWRGNTVDFLFRHNPDNILLEGSQGYALSFFHHNYPKSTSRDCTASGFVSMAGLPPRNVRDVFGVYRTYPIRVAGNSGHLDLEVDWETVTINSGLVFDGGLDGGTVHKDSGFGNLTETTTVTGRIRRVGHWDMSLYRESMAVNGVNRPIITFLNYLNYTDEGIESFEDLSEESRLFLGDLYQATGIRPFMASTSKLGGWVSISEEELGEDLVT